MWIHSREEEHTCQVVLAAYLRPVVTEAAMQTPSQEQGGMCRERPWTLTQVPALCVSVCVCVCVCQCQQNGGQDSCQAFDSIDQRSSEFNQQQLLPFHVQLLQLEPACAAKVVSIHAGFVMHLLAVSASASQTAFLYRS